MVFIFLAYFTLYNGLQFHGCFIPMYDKIHYKLKKKMVQITYSLSRKRDTNVENRLVDTGEGEGGKN